MDRSARQAIATHPELKKYIFAIPFDPTGNRGPKVRERSQRDKLNEKVKEWKQLASESDLEFGLWAETDIVEMLLQNENEGLLRYWFKEEVLHDKWFCQQVKSSIKQLGNQYNPKDHIDVEIDDLFDMIVRGPVVSKNIASAFDDLRKSRVPMAEANTTDISTVESLQLKAETAWSEVSQFAGCFSQDFSSPWPVEKALEKLLILKEAAEELERLHKSAQKTTKKQTKEYKIKSTISDLQKIISTCSDLEKILKNSYISAEKTQCCLVHGITGTGKSHILAHVAEKRVEQKLPTTLMLGQLYSDSPFWFQTGKLLELRGETSKEILGVMDAVGSEMQQRVLLLFDAINDGVGFQYWRTKLPELVEELKTYPNVAMVFTCRQEYLPSDLHKVLEDLPEYRILGFSSPEECRNALIRYLGFENASKIYTQWLAPELRNPLYLKILGEALKNKVVSEPPNDIQGTSQIISLYLDALSSRLESNLGNAEGISRDIKRVALEVASKMAERGSDFLNTDDVNRITRRCFSGKAQPLNKSWLQVLSEISLFRIDPPSFSESGNPMRQPPDNVRFTFQRIQDHLMAMSLADKIRKDHETEAFVPGGALSFLFAGGYSGNELNSKFAGLVDALSTIFPEKFGIEFLMAFPDRDWTSEDIRMVRKGFASSLKWRTIDAFTDQSPDLINDMGGHHADALGSLLEVAMIVDHPCNALFLHEHLKHLSLPERDSKWTRWINQDSRFEDSQIERIISWSLTLPDHDAGFDELKLASIVLTWSLSSSYMTLRDRATKALSSVFLERSSIFEFVAPQIHNCDDPYVIERLYAAAFGACCIDQTSERLSSYSSMIYDLVFADGKPPIGLLARDYALGVIELAEAKGVLSNKVHLPKCYHPFSSHPPTFGLREEEVEKIAEHAGGKQIFRSAAGEWGDYGKYSIPGRVNFLNASLQEPRPLTEDELKEQFFAKAIKPFPQRVSALSNLEALIKIERSLPFINLISESTRERVNSILENRPMDDKVRRSTKQHAEKIEQARTELEQHLSSDERKRLSSEYLREGKANQNDDRVSVDQCRLWVTKRAYELGWTSELFPEDGENAHFSRAPSDLERIGKKYQRIALDELQARLADNYWILQNNSEIPTIYRHSDHDFRRNIEPTILPSKTRYGNSCDAELDWAKQPEVILPHVDGSDLIEWPFQEDPTASFKSKIFRTDQNGDKWLVLYEFSLDSQKHSDPRPAEHGTRYEEFRFIYCVLTPQGKSTELVKHLNRKKNLDVSSFQPREFTDGPYLLEAHWRDTWQSQKFSKRIWGMPKDLEFAIPVADYHWESHLDKTLPEGFSRHLPQMWFADELRLKMANSNANSWTNSEDRTVLTSISGREGRSTVVIDERTFMDYASQFNMEPVWVMIAERSAWPSGGNDSFRGRRAEAVAWYDGKTLRKRGWKRDTKKMMPSKV